MKSMNIILSIFLGMLPEVIYFYLFFIYVKNIKEKRIKLFLGILISYLLCIFLAPYEIFYYVIFIVFLYATLKILYLKEIQIIDVFIVMYGISYLALLSLLIYFAYDFKSYVVCYIINRILLFSIFIFRKHFNKLYIKYCKYWNRNDNIKRPIKSITLRNVSLIILNCIIFIINMICIYMINLIAK